MPGFYNAGDQNQGLVPSGKAACIAVQKVSFLTVPTVRPSLPGLPPRRRLFQKPPSSTFWFSTKWQQVASQKQVPTAKRRQIPKYSEGLKGVWMRTGFTNTDRSTRGDVYVSFPHQQLCSPPKFWRLRGCKCGKERTRGANVIFWSFLLLIREKED